MEEILEPLVIAIVELTACYKKKAKHPLLCSLILTVLIGDDFHVQYSSQMKNCKQN